MAPKFSLRLLFGVMTFTAIVAGMYPLTHGETPSLGRVMFVSTFWAAFMYAFSPRK
jgi:hypothetical protein